MGDALLVIQKLVVVRAQDRIARQKRAGQRFGIRRLRVPPAVGHTQMPRFHIGLH